jgi:hypothetical protein
MISRIALFGTRERLKSWLADLLRKSGFEVDHFDPDAVSSLFDACLDTYTLVIADTGVAARLEEETAINASLIAQGFLVFDDQIKTAGREPSFLIHAGMGQEEIIAKINDIVFFNSQLRKTTRLRLSLPIEYEYSGNHFHSTMQDISENGAFIITLLPPPIQEKITIHFSLPGYKDLRITCRVIHSINCDLEQSIIVHPSSPEKKIVALPGIGVLFEQITDDDRNAIRTFIRQASY